MAQRDRAFTRSTIRRAKRKAARIMKLWRWFEDDAITPKQVGRAASVHCRICSCVMCGNPRKYFGALTVQEKRQVSYEWQSYGLGRVPGPRWADDPERQVYK